MNILNSVKSFLQFPTKNRKVETSITTSTIMTQKVDIQLEGRSLVSRYQPFASSLYNIPSILVGICNDQALLLEIA